jgi:ribosomal protein L18E
LTTLVHEHGASAWTLIASKLAGGRRSNEQCKAHWRTIDPSLTTGKFSFVEDASLTKLVEEHGASAWTLIASKLEGGRRNDKQCKSRWKAIDPSLSTGKFSLVEDASLTKLVEEHGASAWTLIASKLEGGRRNDKQCKSRWKAIDPSLSTGHTTIEADEAQLSEISTMLASDRRFQIESQIFNCLCDGVSPSNYLQC